MAQLRLPWLRRIDGVELVRRCAQKPRGGPAVELWLRPGQRRLGHAGGVRATMLAARTFSCRLLGVRSHLIGAGFDVPSDERVPRSDRLWMRMLATIAVRDPASLRLLDSERLQPQLAPDLAVADPQDPSTVHGPRAGLVVSCRARSGDADTPLYSEALALDRSQWPIVTAVSQVASDDQLNQRLATALGSAAVIRYDGSAASEAAIRHAYGRAEVVVSDRLHVCLLAMKAGAVVIPAAVGHAAPKLSAFFGDSLSHTWVGDSPLVSAIQSALRNQRVVIEEQGLALEMQAGRLDEQMDAILAGKHRRDARSRRRTIARGTGP